MNKLTDTEHWEDNWKDIKLPLTQNLGNYATKQVHELFVKYLPRNGRFIELGGAPGSWMIYFKKYFNSEVHCLDYTTTGCNATKRNLKLCGVKGVVHQMDLFNHKLKKESFDIVMSDGLIEHFSEPLEIVKKHYELVKKGGWLVVRIPNLYSKPAKMAMKMHDSEHKHYPISKTDMSGFMKELGAEIVHLDFIGGFNPNVVDWAKYNSPLMKAMKKILNIGLKTALTILPKRENKNLSPNIIVIAKKP